MLLTQKKLTEDFSNGEKCQTITENLSISERILESFMDDNKKKLLAIPVSYM